MTLLEAALRRIHTDLTEADVSFALVGGLAVSARTEPRFTRDADLAVAVADDAEAEALIHHLRIRDYGIEAIVEQDAVGRLATVRLTRSSQSRAPVVDLLFASSGIEPEVVTEADPIELLPNFTIGVALTGHLIALKVFSRRRREPSAGSGGPLSSFACRVIGGAGASARVARAHCGSRISQGTRPAARAEAAARRSFLSAGGARASM